MRCSTSEKISNKHPLKRNLWGHNARWTKLCSRYSIKAEAQETQTIFQHFTNHSHQQQFDQIKRETHLLVHSNSNNNKNSNNRDIIRISRYFEEVLSNRKYSRTKHGIELVRNLKSGIRNWFRRLQCLSRVRKALTQSNDKKREGMQGNTKCLVNLSRHYRHLMRNFDGAF